jgi:hypothetical protein
LQTNGSISDRFIKHPDGTMSAVWTTLCPGGASATDRGTGYNYFDGTSWLPSVCERIEPTQRSGFPNIGVTTSSKEIVLAHSSTVGGMLLTYRLTKGTGSWIEDGTSLGQFPDDTWAKMVIGGSDSMTVHAIWNASGISINEYCGQLGPIVYSRSTDGGVTWPILRQCIAELDTPFYLGFGADRYSIDAQGDSVAIVAGDWTTDMVLLKSTDNGDTWTKQIIYQFPFPNYDETAGIIDTNADGTADIIAVPNGDGQVAYDNNGMLHVVFSKVFITDDVETDAAGFFPTDDAGIWYWNESMATDSAMLIAAAEDFNNNDSLDVPVSTTSHTGVGVYNGGLSLMPTIGFDPNNNIFVTYATYNELADTSVYLSGRRHVYVIASFDGAQNWTVPLNVVPSSAEGGDGEFQEAVFSCMAEVVDENVHIIYQRDEAPGHSLSGDTEQAAWNSNPSNIIYVSVAMSELTGTPSVNSTSFFVSQNMPNPANDQTQINVSLTSASEIKINVLDLAGRLLLSTPSNNYGAGSHLLTIDCSKLSSGVYLYEVSAGDEKWINTDIQMTTNNG